MNIRTSHPNSRNRLLVTASAAALLVEGIVAPALAERRPPEQTTTRIQVPQGPFVDCGDFVSTARFNVLRTDQWINGLAASATDALPSR